MGFALDQMIPVVATVAEANARIGHAEWVLEDAGTAFDPTAGALPNPAGSLAQAKVGGPGLTLVRRTAQALRCCRTSAGRNRFEVELTPG